VDSAIAARAGAILESMLLEPVLRPLLSRDEAFGEYGAGLLARSIAERDSHGFAALLATQLELPGD
jgi:hypothetical protein